MTFTQHTPGPWVIHLTDDRSEETGLIHGGYDAMYHICDTGIAGSYNTLANPNTYTDLAIVQRQIEVARANARLIAAAPDLLQALQTLFNALGQIKQGIITDIDANMDCAYAVITKAEGRS